MKREAHAQKRHEFAALPWPGVQEKLTWKWFRSNRSLKIDIQSIKGRCHQDAMPEKNALLHALFTPTRFCFVKSKKKSKSQRQEESSQSENELELGSYQSEKGSGMYCLILARSESCSILSASTASSMTRTSRWSKALLSLLWCFKVCGWLDEGRSFDWPLTPRWPRVWSGFEQQEKVSFFMVVVFALCLESSV